MTASIFTIGIVGHRDLGDKNDGLYVQLCCHKILSELRYRYPKIKAISAISEGADSIFAQSAIALDIQLESVIPFDDFKSDFPEETSYERYKSLRKKSDYETRVNFSGRSNLAYKKSMEWVVFKSDIVLAVWDGKEIGSIGGTWEAVLLCEKFNKTIIHIDTCNRVMSLYFHEGNKYSPCGNITADHIVRYI